MNPHLNGKEKGNPVFGSNSYAPANTFLERFTLLMYNKTYFLVNAFQTLDVCSQFFLPSKLLTFLLIFHLLDASPNTFFGFLMSPFSKSFKAGHYYKESVHPRYGPTRYLKLSNAAVCCGVISSHGCFFLMNCPYLHLHPGGPHCPLSSPLHPPQTYPFHILLSCFHISFSHFIFTLICDALRSLRSPRDQVLPTFLFSEPYLHLPGDRCIPHCECLPCKHNGGGKHFRQVHTTPHSPAISSYPPAAPGRWARMASGS